jgi:hypothetical protein
VIASIISDRRLWTTHPNFKDTGLGEQWKQDRGASPETLNYPGSGSAPCRPRAVTGECDREKLNLRLRDFLPTSLSRRSEKFFVANLAAAAATHSTHQDGENTIAEESPTRSVLKPLIGRARTPHRNVRDA